MIVDSLIFGKSRNRSQTKFLNNRAPIRSIPAGLSGKARIVIKDNHIYLECGEGKPLIFCHGLFGGIHNIDKVAACLSDNFRFIMPFLPMYDLPLIKCRVRSLGEYLQNFSNELNFKKAVYIGNSMGGGAAAYLASFRNQNIGGLVLCGSSGLSNIPLSKGYFQRKNYSFVRSATEDIFYNRSIPSKEMINDVFNAIQSTELVIRSIRFTKSAVHEKMHAELSAIHTNTLLIWGKQDPVTPVEVAPEFNRLIKNSELQIIDECGHVPSQEKPEEFLTHLYSFLKRINY